MLKPTELQPRGRQYGSVATQQAREHVRRLASSLDYPEAAVHLTLALNAILRRLDELEARQ